MTTNSKPHNVLIVGASSGIAREAARVYAERGDRLVLAGRDQQALQEDADDLRVRHQAQAEVVLFDALPPSADGLDELEIDIALLCYGVMLDNDTARSDPEAHRRMIEVNYTSYALLLEQLSDHMNERGGGVIAVLSSVAGDRGRGSNYCYGATKAALSAYADGLRGRLNNSGVHVVTIKPGPTATPMTAGMDQAKMAEPKRVAKQIVRAIDQHRDIVYTPGKWRLIMAVIRAIPERLFKKLSI